MDFFRKPNVPLCKTSTYFSHNWHHPSWVSVHLLDCSVRLEIRYNMLSVDSTPWVLLVKYVHSSTILFCCCLADLMSSKFGHDRVPIGISVVSQQVHFLWKRKLPPWSYIGHQGKLTGIIEVTKETTLHISDISAGVNDYLKRRKTQAYQYITLLGFVYNLKHFIQVMRYRL